MHAWHNHSDLLTGPITFSLNLDTDTTWFEDLFLYHYFFCCWNLYSCILHKYVCSIGAGDTSNHSTHLGCSGKHDPSGCSINHRRLRLAHSHSNSTSLDAKRLPWATNDFSQSPSGKSTPRPEVERLLNIDHTSISPLSGCVSCLYICLLFWLLGFR